MGEDMTDEIQPNYKMLSHDHIFGLHYILHDTHLPVT